MTREKGLFLDDVRTPSTSNEIEWSIVRSYKDFVNWIISNGMPDRVSFDHDLAMEHTLSYIDQCKGENLANATIDYSNFKEKTGYDCAKWLCEYCLDNNLLLPPVITVHSANYPGSMNIMNYITNYRKIRGENTLIYRTIW